MSHTSKVGSPFSTYEKTDAGYNAPLPVAVGENKMVRFDFACKKCEKTFTVWSDEARRCAYCGSTRVFKIFLTPPAALTGEPARIDKLAEQQIAAAGLSNYTNAHGAIKRTRATDPKLLEAQAAAKKANVPFEIKTGPSGTLATQATAPQQVPVALGREVASRGKGHVTHMPKGSGALVDGLMNRAKSVFNPLRGPYRLPKDGGREDSAKLQSMLKR